MGGVGLVQPLPKCYSSGREVTVWWEVLLEAAQQFSVPGGARITGRPGWYSTFSMWSKLLFLGAHHNQCPCEPSLCPQPSSLPASHQHQHGQSIC